MIFFLLLTTVVSSLFPVISSETLFVTEYFSDSVCANSITTEVKKNDGVCPIRAKICSKMKAKFEVYGLFSCLPKSQFISLSSDSVGYGLYTDSDCTHIFSAALFNPKHANQCFLALNNTHHDFLCEGGDFIFKSDCPPGCHFCESTLSFSKKCHLLQAEDEHGHPLYAKAIGCI